METGNKPTTGYKKTFSVSPDKEGAISNISSVAHLTRNQFIKSRFSTDLLVLEEMVGYEYPYCSDDGAWAQIAEELTGTIESEPSAVLFEPKAFTLIPKSLFRQADIPKYFDLLGSSIHDQVSIESPLEHLNAIMVSTVPEEISRIIAKEKLIPDTLPVLHALNESHEGSMHLIMRSEHVDVIILHNGIKLANRFSGEHENDVLYFCIAAIEQCGLSLDKVEVSISGRKNRLDSVKPLLGKYIPNLKRSLVPKKVSLPYSFKDVEPSWCWPILNSYLCG